MSRHFLSGALLTLISLAACSGAPPYVLGTSSSVAPAAPKVSDLVANLKCELWDAANSRDVLTYFDDRPGRHVHELKSGFDTNDRTQPNNDARRFTLRNYFQEIEYVADVQLTLDVKDAGGFNPTIALSKYYSASKGVFPATGALLSVGGAFSDTGHRYVQIYLSVDFMRLVPSPPYANDPGKNIEIKPADYQPALAPPIAVTDVDYGSYPVLSPCQDSKGRERGVDLGGRLGLKETLATAIIAQAMNDITLFPPTNATPEFIGEAPVPDNGNNQNGKYTFGVISTQVDFTIQENVNGGPTWTLQYVKFPGQSSSGLFSYNRQVTDTLLITFVPVCIRQKYHTNTPLPSASSTDSSPRFEYEPEMIVGTPGWANYLPPCYLQQDTAPKPTAAKAAPGPSLASRKQSAAATARTYNLLRGLTILNLPQ